MYSLKHYKKNERVVHAHTKTHAIKLLILALKLKTIEFANLFLK